MRLDVETSLAKQLAHPVDRATLVLSRQGYAHEAGASLVGQAGQAPIMKLVADDRFVIGSIAPITIDYANAEMYQPLGSEH